jgi:hypothetical protein
MKKAEDAIEDERWSVETMNHEIAEVGVTRGFCVCDWDARPHRFIRTPDSALVLRTLCQVGRVTDVPGRAPRPVLSDSRVRAALSPISVVLHKVTRGLSSQEGWGKKPDGNLEEVLMVPHGGSSDRSWLDRDSR